MLRMLYQALMLQRMWGGSEAACSLPPDLEAMAKQVGLRHKLVTTDVVGEDAALSALWLCQHHITSHAFSCCAC